MHSYATYTNSQRTNIIVNHVVVQISYSANAEK